PTVTVEPTWARACCRLFRPTTTSSRPVGDRPSRMFGSRWPLTGSSDIPSMPIPFKRKVAPAMPPTDTSEIEESLTSSSRAFDPGSNETACPLSYATSQVHPYSRGVAAKCLTLIPTESAASNTTIPTTAAVNDDLTGTVARPRPCSSANRAPNAGEGLPVTSPSTRETSVGRALELKDDSRCTTDAARHEGNTAHAIT